MDDYLRFAVQTAQEAAKILQNMRENVTPRRKAARDFVTEADLASQRFIQQEIAAHFPQHFVIAEEGQPSQPKPPTGNLVWLIDPLDGTTNFIHGVPHYCVSMALGELESTEAMRLICGVVVDPNRQECFSALRGQGAWLNDRPLQVAETTAIEDGLIAFSLSAVADPHSQEVQEMLHVAESARSVRRTGSAALNLAYVSAGRFCGYWARNLQPWDAAAGALLVQEAGGLIESLSDTPFEALRPELLCSCSAPLLRSLKSLISDSRR